LVRLGSDVNCHAICRDISSDLAGIDAGVLCARGGGQRHDGVDEKLHQPRDFLI
jgi:hypothetical protein